METRPYFVFGDFVANALAGAGAGCVTAIVIGPGWNMFIGMLLGMLVGMVVAIVASFAAFVWLFGAMEVMLPVMLTGMVAGMLVGMAAPMAEMGAARAAQIGAVSGLGVVVFTYLLDATLRGRAGKWTT